MKSKTHLWPGLVVPLIALILRLGYLAWRWPLLPDWNVDAVGYHQLALNLLERGTFSLNSQPPFHPDALRTPAYPILLASVYAVFGNLPRAVLVLQAILDSATVWVVMATTRELSRANMAALAAGGLYAVSPLGWRYSAELYSETALAGLVALCFFILAHAAAARRPGLHHAVGLGGVCALGLLIKPGVWLLPVLVVPLLWMRGSFRHVALFGAIFGVLLAPWIIRNALVFGRPMLSTVVDVNLARVSAPAALAEARGERVAPWTPRWEALYLEVVAAAAKREPALFGTPSDELTPAQRARVDAELGRAARAIIAANPLAFTASHLRGAMGGLLPQDYRFWYAALGGQAWEKAMPMGIGRTWLSAGWRGVPLLAAGLFIIFSGFYLVLLAAAFVGAWRLRRRHPLVALGMVTCIAYLLVLPGPIAYDRFRVPVMPVVSVLAACAYVRKGGGELRNRSY